jgi:hypothetical protein
MLNDIQRIQPMDFTMGQCIINGMLDDTVPYEAVYSIAKALLFRGKLLCDLKELSENANDSRFVPALLAPPKDRIDVSHLVYWPELTAEARNNLKL